MGIYKLDQQRQLDHNDFINKDKDFLSNIKELKDQMIKMTNEQEVKSKFLIDETHKTLESSYTELQDTIWDLRRSVSTRKCVDEILTISKDIYDYLKHPAMLTTNGLSGQILIQFGKTSIKLNELEDLFKEKRTLSSSTWGKYQAI